MSRDFDRIRAGSNGSSLPPMRSDRQGSMAFLGRVISTGSNLGVGIFVRVQRLTILGNPVEGGSGESSDTPDGGTLVLFLGENVPAEDDEVICWREKNRWVARKRGTYYAGPSIEYVLTPGCGCHRVPRFATLTTLHDGTPAEGGGIIPFSYDMSWSNQPDYSSVPPLAIASAGYIGDHPGYWSNSFQETPYYSPFFAQGFMHVSCGFNTSGNPVYGLDAWVIAYDDFLGREIWQLRNFWVWNVFACNPFLLYGGSRSPFSLPLAGATLS